jgi:DNA invertase Pin-like site-specific DNA recombinase
MAFYGYARVSTDGQSLTSQDAELHAAGCAKVYAERFTALAATARSSPRCSSASTQAMC